MRVFKYTILLANALFIACGDDDNTIDGSNDNTIGSTASHWRGIEIRPENRCSPYDRSDYPYPPSVEDVIIEELGGIYSPYTRECFSNSQETQIEHIVALSEAHDSGLCDEDRQIRREFASDPLNLTLASPALNGSDKRHYDGAEWMPPMNKCWFAQRIVEVRQKYGLTIDRLEAEALERILSACSSVEIEFIDCASTIPVDSDALNEYDDDGDGSITCAEARSHGIAPVHRGHPAYPYMDDADRDGIVCEDNNAGTFTEADSCSAEALNEYDDNGNGHISCEEAEHHGIAPVPRSHPAYPCMRDGDGDGVVCE